MWKTAIKLTILSFIFYATNGMARIYSSSIEVSINQEIWHGGDIRWPSDIHSVIFYYKKPSDIKGCGGLGKDFFATVYSDQTKRDLRMGEICNRLVVVFRDDVFEMEAGNLGLEFAARHEAFHLAAQIYGSRVSLEYLQTQRRVATGRSAEFFDQLVNAFPLADVESHLPSISDVCRAIFPKYLDMSDDEKQEIDSLVFWEWPAEYYAYRSLKQEGRIDAISYERIRRLAGSYEEYSPGISIGLILDGMFDSRDWQARIKEGESMLDIIGAECFSDYKPLPKISVQVKRMDFPKN